jgi:hypothetical protein
MPSKCGPFSKGPVVAISGEVDTCSISSGDGWTEGRNRDEPEVLWESVAFLKEPGGISRIPTNGIIELV